MATTPTQRASSAFDELFDLLHEHMCCGCQDCAKSTLQYARMSGGRYWFAVALPNGQRPDETQGATLADAVRRWVTANHDSLTERVSA